MEKNITTKELYNLTIAFGGILGIYTSMIPGVSLYELMILMWFFWGLRYKQKKIDLSRSMLLLFCIYSGGTVLLSMLLNANNSLFYSHRYLRFLLYSMCVVFTSKELFDVTIFLKYSKILIAITFIALCMQYLLFYAAGTHLILYNKVFNIMSTEYLELDYERFIEYGVFRPSAFFLEPSHLSQNFVVILTILLFCKSPKDKSKYVYALITTICIFLSTSMYGIVLTLAISVLLYFRNIDKKKGQLLLFLFFALYIIRGFINKSFERLDFNDLLNDSTFTTRFLGYDIIKTSFLPLFFGNGFGMFNGVRYINSVIYLLYSVGIIGGLIYALFLCVSFQKTNLLYSRLLIVIFFFLMFGSSIFISPISIMFFSIILYPSHTNEEEKIQSTVEDFEMPLKPAQSYPSPANIIKQEDKD